MGDWRGNTELDWQKEGSDRNREIGGQFDKVPNRGDAMEVAETGGKGLPGVNEVPLGNQFFDSGRTKEAYDCIAEKGSEPLWDKTRENGWPGGMPSDYKDGGQIGPEKVKV